MIIIKQETIMYDVDNNHIKDNIRKIELAGRTCYKSENLISENSSENFIKSLIKRGHESVLEHGSVTFKIITNRAISHEIVRHRIASYSQESTRYCNYSKDKFNEQLTFIAPSFIQDIKKEYNLKDYYIEAIVEHLSYLKNLPMELLNSLETNRKKVNMHYQTLTAWYTTMRTIELNYLHLLEEGLTPDSARGILPNDLKTELIMTMNFRELRHFIKLRASKSAHPQIREIAINMLYLLNEHYPVIFNDLFEQFLIIKE